jgi:hypothetical protein
MVTITNFVVDGRALWNGGNPKIGPTAPPAEMTDTQYADIKAEANGTIKGDTGIRSVDDSDLVAELLKNAANVYAGILIRRRWTDKGNKLPSFEAEYQRLLKSIAEYEDETQPEVGRNAVITTQYQSHGLNPEVDPYFSVTD